MKLTRYLQFTHTTQGRGFVRDTFNLTYGRPNLLLDYNDSSRGTMLSDTLKEFRETDSERMQNLFRGISRMMLSLATKAQPSYWLASFQR